MPACATIASWVSPLTCTFSVPPRSPSATTSLATASVGFESESVRCVFPPVSCLTRNHTKSTYSLSPVFLMNLRGEPPTAGLRDRRGFDLDRAPHHRLSDDSAGHDEIAATVLVDGEEYEVTGSGNGPIAAFVDALTTLGFDVRVLDYFEHAMAAGDNATAAAYLECAIDEQVLWGAGVSGSIVTASLNAVVSAINRAMR